MQEEAIVQLDADVKQILAVLSANAGQIVPLREKLTALGDELGTLPSVEEKLKKFSLAEGEVASEVDQAHALKALRDRERRVVDDASEIL